MSFDPAAVEVLLCDADGNLFPSEEPAFEASTAVMNDLLMAISADYSYQPDELRREGRGRSFRSTARELAARHGVQVADPLLEVYVEKERRRVTAHLAEVLRPNAAVQAPLRELAGRFRLAVVSSSASERLDACFAATGLAELFPPLLRFSAEDSLPTPASKPDPAIYVYAGQRLGVSAGRALAVEDAVTGVQSAVAAGFPVVGNVTFVPEAEREAGAAALLEAGAATVVGSWWELCELLRVPVVAQGAA
jgi:beta-phosphoglucomutase-like phosphatase (HAD superfamily)